VLIRAAGARLTRNGIEAIVPLMVV
jgi:hypothetical protein